MTAWLLALLIAAQAATAASFDVRECGAKGDGTTEDTFETRRITR
jgi:hypothetical protein